MIKEFLKLSLWSGNAVSYTLGDLVTYNGKIYKVVFAHTSAAKWHPNAVSYFEEQPAIVVSDSDAGRVSPAAALRFILTTTSFSLIKGFLLSRVDIGGYSAKEIITKSTKTTVFRYKELMQRSVRNKWDAKTLDFELEKLRRARKHHILTTQKNIASAVRGYGRSLLATGRSGRFYNVTVLDSKTTYVCARYVGKSWAKPYSAIPDKPPRTSKLIHRCRSYLEFRSKPPKNNGDFMAQWNKGGDELKLKLLKPVRFKAYKSGKLKINSYAQFEKAVLFTIEELKLK